MELDKIIVLHCTTKGRFPIERLTKKKKKELKKKYREIKKKKKYEKVSFEGMFLNEEGFGYCEWKGDDEKRVLEMIAEILGKDIKELQIDKIIKVKEVLTLK
jgi:hypothetical protein